MKASASPLRKNLSLPLGIPEIDNLTGINGLVLRGITQVSGPYSQGKTTLGYIAIAAAQKEGKDTLWVDTEASFFAAYEYAQGLGVDMDNLDFINERLAEDNLDKLEDWLDAHKNAYAVLDSFSRLLTKEEAEKRAADRTIAQRARILSPWLRRIHSRLIETGNGLFICNTEYADLMTGKINTPGGKAIEHHSGLWLRMKPTTKRLMSGENQVGKVVKIKVQKSKVSKSEGQEAEIQILFGGGINKTASLMDTALDRGLIEKKGNTFFFEGAKLCVGQAKLREKFAEPDFADKLRGLMKNI